MILKRFKFFSEELEDEGYEQREFNNKSMKAIKKIWESNHGGREVIKRTVLPEASRINNIINTKGSVGILNGGASLKRNPLLSGGNSGFREGVLNKSARKGTKYYQTEYDHGAHSIFSNDPSGLATPKERVKRAKLISKDFRRFKPEEIF